MSLLTSAETPWSPPRSPLTLSLFCKVIHRLCEDTTSRKAAKDSSLPALPPTRTLSFFWGYCPPKRALWPILEAVPRTHYERVVFSCLNKTKTTFGVVQSRYGNPFFILAIELFLPAGQDEQLSGHLHEVLLLQFLVVVLGALAAVVHEYCFDLLDHSLFGVIEALVLVGLVGGFLGFFVHLFYWDD